MGEPTKDRLDEWFDLMGGLHGLYQQRLLFFLEQASDLSRRVAGGTASHAETQLFFVRLYGVAHDVWKRYQDATPVRPPGQSAPDEDDYLGQLQDMPWKIRTKIAKSLSALRDQFSDEEKIYLEVVRNEVSHPYLSSNIPKLEGDEDKWDSFRVNLLGKRWVKIGEALATMAALESAAGSADILHRQFAQRSAASLMALENCFRNLFILRPGPS